MIGAKTALTKRALNRRKRFGRSTECECCGSAKWLTEHHPMMKPMIQRTRRRDGNNSDNKKRLIKILLCSDCHNRVHELIPRLVLKLDTPDKIRKFIFHNEIEYG